MEIVMLKNIFKIRMIGLVLLSVLILPVVIFLPVIDRDEARFAQASKQMLETGEYIDIRFQNAARHKKPAGAYWAQAASVQLLGQELNKIPPYRVPSWLAILGSFLILLRIARRLMPDKLAFAAALCFCLNPITLSQGIQARADALLLLAALIAFDALHLIWQKKATRKDSIIFWAALGASALIKGPIVPACILASILWLAIASPKKTAALISDLRPFEGFIIAAIIALPWYFLIQSHGDGNFVKTALFKDFLPKLRAAQESHSGAPGYYLLLLVFGAFPLIAPRPIALIKHWWCERRTPDMLFLIAWLVPAWLVFEIIPTKLPHYTLFLTPAFYLGTFCFFAKNTTVKNALGAYGALGLWLAVTTSLLLIGPAFLPASTEKTYVLGFGLALILLLASASALALKKARTNAMIAICASFTIGAAFTLFGTLILPAQKNLWIAEQMHRALPYNSEIKPIIGVRGFSEPSVVFLLGTDTALNPDAKEISTKIAKTGKGYIFCADISFCKTVQKTLGSAFQSRWIETISGVNYSNGDSLKLDLVEFKAIANE